MRKLILFDKKRSWWFSIAPDVDLLNNQIGEIERDGWKVISITGNTNLFGSISSFTILVEKANE